MSTTRRLAETTHVVALATWLGAGVISGVTAAVVFPTMKELSPTLPGYGAYSGEHWRIAAGSVANRVFLVCDTIALACALVTILTLAISLRTYRRSAETPVRALWLRVAWVSVACGVLAFNLFILQPRMAKNLRSFWNAARAGAQAEADAAQQRFAADHPNATLMLGATAAAVLASLVAAAWSATRTPEAPGRGPS